MVPISIPTHLPIDRAHALALGHTHVGPTQADVHEVNAHQSVKFVPPSRWDYQETMTKEDIWAMNNGFWAPTLTSASGQWDNDWNRMSSCYDPCQKIQSKVTYTYGMLNGLWQGRMLVRIAFSFCCDLDPECYLYIYFLCGILGSGSGCASRPHCHRKRPF